MAGEGQFDPGDNCRVTKVGNILRKTKIDELKTRNIIIATGSSPVRLQQASLMEGYILDSAGALELDAVPERLGIIGAGAIGLEVGSVWSRLGSQVVLLEAMHEFLAIADSKLARLAKRSLIKQSLDIRLDARMVSAEVKNKKVHVVYEDKAGEQKEVFDKLLPWAFFFKSPRSKAFTIMGLKYYQKAYHN